MLSLVCIKLQKTLRIIFTLYAQLQTILLTPVKFQRNHHKTVGGFAITSFLLLEGGRNAKHYVPQFFFERRGAIKQLLSSRCVAEQAFPTENLVNQIFFFNSTVNKKLSSCWLLCEFYNYVYSSCLAFFSHPADIANLT